MSTAKLVPEEFGGRLQHASDPAPKSSASRSAFVAATALTSRARRFRAPSGQTRSLSSWSSARGEGGATMSPVMFADDIHR